MYFVVKVQGCWPAVLPATCSIRQNAAVARNNTVPAKLHPCAEQRGPSTTQFSRCCAECGPFTAACNLIAAGGLAKPVPSRPW